MLLAIDIGNTHIVLGVFAGRRVTHSWRIATVRERTSDELGLQVMQLIERAGIRPARIDGVVLASVVPPLTGAMIDMCRRYLRTEPLNLEPGVTTGMPVLYENPAEVGADRIVNGMAAWERYGRVRRTPLIVVDFGTATTFDAISAEGEYLGGAICPGIQISADALFQRAARLPRIDVRRPACAIGRTTVTSMQSGLFFGYVGMVEGLVHRLRAELGGHAYCVATGGLAEVIAPETHVVDAVDRDLTLHGLWLLWERNKGTRKKREARSQNSEFRIQRPDVRRQKPDARKRKTGPGKARS
jgi:type III pantothenate kinase